jgi:hypothetical protein
VETIDGRGGGLGARTGGVSVSDTELRITIFRFSFRVWGSRSVLSVYGINK